MDDATADDNLTDDPITDDRAARVGYLLDDELVDGLVDDQADLVADEADMTGMLDERSAEEAAMHLDEAPPYRREDSYLDE